MSEQEQDLGRDRSAVAEVAKGVASQFAARVRIIVALTLRTHEGVYYVQAGELAAVESEAEGEIRVRLGRYSVPLRHGEYNREGSGGQGYTGEAELPVDAGWPLE